MLRTLSKVPAVSCVGSLQTANATKCARRKELLSLVPPGALFWVPSQWRCATFGLGVLCDPFFWSLGAVCWALLFEGSTLNWCERDEFLHMLWTLLRYDGQAVSREPDVVVELGWSNNHDRVAGPATSDQDAYIFLLYILTCWHVLFVFLQVTLSGCGSSGWSMVVACPTACCAPVFFEELFVQQSKMKVGVMENCNTISMCVSKRWVKDWNSVL